MQPAAPKPKPKSEKEEKELVKMITQQKEQKQEVD